MKRGRDIGIVEFPRGSSAWHARVIHQGKQYWRRAANKSHARELYDEMKTLIRKGEFPPQRNRRPVFFADLLEHYRAVKRREGKAVMASDIGYVRLLERFGGKHAAEISVSEVDSWRRDLAETMRDRQSPPSPLAGDPSPCRQNASPACLGATRDRLA
jgi:hypothetical protein